MMQRRNARDLDEVSSGLARMQFVSLIYFLCEVRKPPRELTILVLQLQQNLGKTGYFARVPARVCVCVRACVRAFLVVPVVDM